ncbi:DNA repair protein endonuclease SAE2/CtIP C-terminus-domain-containing protein [Podospora conica]|nr:DNA repair protein endonuclease SAE2/CtIP C-terminus-domain-containing protein [Schizothecium conicum]
MEFWDDKAEPSILLAVQSACEAIRGGLVNELQARDQNRHAFLTEEVNRLKDVAAKVGRLELENLQLQQELETLRTERATHTCTPSIEGDGGPGCNRGVSMELGYNDSRPADLRQVPEETPANTSDADQNAGMGPDYATLAKQYAALLSRFESKQKASRKLKEKTKQWIKYAESKDSKIRKLEKKLHALGVSREPEPNPTRENTHAPDNDMNNIVSSNTSIQANSEVHDNQQGPANDAGQDGQISKAVRTSTVSVGPETEVDTSDVAQESIEPPEDEDLALPELPPLPPLLHLVTPGRQDVGIKPEPSSDEPVVVSERIIRKRRHDGEDDMPPPRARVKTETTILSSDPVFTEGHVSFLPHESLDLDEGNDGVPTPRKHRFLGVQTVPSAPVARETTHPKDNGNALPVGAPLAPATSNMASRRVARAWPGATEVSDTARASHIEYGIAAVAEDDGSFVQAPEPRRNLGQDDSEQAMSSRLRTLLSKKTTEAAPVLSRHDLEMARNLARPNLSDTGLDLVALRPESKERRSTLITPNRVPLAPKANHTMPNMRVPPQKDDGQKKTSRLRLLPPDKLRLEDFKINPKFNGGYKHAFDDVVRDKAGRAALAGCVDPKCCGKQFEAIAQSELDHGGTAILTREPDMELMEEFLGEDAYRLMGMSLDEKKGIWLKAKIRDLANRYGRCRHRVARRPSPPGYWNPDFPNTQEVQENRQEAESIERRMVDERWQEAKRGGGRWMFRDE